MTTVDPEHWVLPAKKPTRFATNSWAVAKDLSRTCSCKEVEGKPKHWLLLAGRASTAALYADGLCDAI